MATLTDANLTPDGHTRDNVRRRPSPNPSARDGQRADDESSNIFYLAYGSNLCAETFLGKRGIRPLSQTNVYVPLLEFNMNLPGMPYMEPAFANVNFRKLPEKDTAADSTSLAPVDPKRFSAEGWDGGLMGVVYEVTHEDFRQIMRTEGGGSGYQEILIPCVPIDRQAAGAVQDDAGGAASWPIPFLARTLYAPPEIPRAGADESALSRWLRKWTDRGLRPQPGYAQATPRYLKLITDGAKEHKLPEVYQKHLATFQPYKITTLRQQVGRFLSILAFGPLIIGTMTIGKWLADENGRYPRWLARVAVAQFTLVWFVYDHVMKGVFGDGERTEGDGMIKTAVRRPSILAKPQIMIDEEKLELLGE